MTGGCQIKEYQVGGAVAVHRIGELEADVNSSPVLSAFLNFNGV